MKGSTSYKETSFGIIPRSKLIKLELEGIKKGLASKSTGSTKVNQQILSESTDIVDRFKKLAKLKPNNKK